MFTLLAELGIIAFRQIAKLLYLLKAAKPWGDFPEKGIIREEWALNIEWLT